MRTLVLDLSRTPRAPVTEQKETTVQFPLGPLLALESARALASIPPRTKAWSVPAPASALSPEPVLAPAEAARSGIRGEAYALLRAAEGLLASGDVDGAWERAGIAKDLLNDEDLLGAARARMVLSHAQELRGHFAAARRHVERAVALREAMTPDAVPLQWIADAGRLALRLGDFKRARTAFETATAKARSRVESASSRSALHDLCVVLDGLGDARLGLGDPDGAAAALGESLATARRLCDPSAPETCSDLVACLRKTGEVRHSAGDITGALAALEEAVSVQRRLFGEAGGDPAMLRDLTITLNRLGAVQVDAGQVSDATASFEEALWLRRQLQARRPDSPQVLRDLSSSLTKVGDARARTEDQGGAKAAYEEALLVDRGLCEDAVRAPLHLRDLCVSLERVAVVRADEGDFRGAMACCEERVAVAGTLCAQPESSAADREILASALAALAAVRRASLDEPGACAAEEDAARVRAAVSR